MNSLIRSFILLSLLLQPIYFYGAQTSPDSQAQEQQDYNHIDYATAFQYFLLGAPTLLTFFILYRHDHFKHQCQNQIGDLVNRQTQVERQIQDLNQRCNQYDLQIPELARIIALNHATETDRLRRLEDATTDLQSRKPRRSVKASTQRSTLGKDDNQTTIVVASKTGSPLISDDSDSGKGKTVVQPIHTDASPSLEHQPVQPHTLIASYIPQNQRAKIGNPNRLPRKSRSYPGKGDSQGGESNSDPSNSFPSSSIDDLTVLTDKPLPTTTAAASTAQNKN